MSGDSQVNYPENQSAMRETRVEDALEPWEAIRWNQTFIDHAPGSVVTLFERAAREQRENPAIVDATGDVWSYAELNSVANRIARLLVAHGVGVGEAVVVAMVRSPLLVAAVVGIFKARAIYLPVGAEGATSRHDDGLSAIGARYLLSDRSHTTTLKTINLAEADAFQDHDLAVAPSADDMAYAIFTSGSTGRPKLVSICHAALYNQLCWLSRALPLEPSDRAAFKYPIIFDASVGEMFGPLTQGATLITVPEDVARYADRLLHFMIQSDVSILDIVPSHLDALLAQRPFSDWAALRLVIAGGEALRTATVQRFAQVSKAVLWNLYGPTETTITAMAARIDLRHDAIVTIGRPVDNMRVYLLDDNGKPMARGETAEICLAGIQVARGYVGGDVAINAAFGPDPFYPGEQLYRTGDLGRQLSSGDVVFAGRRDDQLNVRGMRVEPGEVEAALNEHSAVDDCAVAMLDQGDHQCLTAWIVVASDKVIDAVSLRADLNRRLAPNMVPALFLRVEALPRTQAGKLDRRALAALPATRVVLGGGSAPQTPTEQMVATLFAECLGHLVDDTHASFFELGGDSLAAVGLVERVHDVLGITLEVRDIFETPSVAGIAARAERHGATTRRPPWSRVADDGKRLVNAAQQQLLDAPIADELAPTCLAIRWFGLLDTSAMDEALRHTVARHPLLHSKFVRDVDGWAIGEGAADGEIALDRVIARSKIPAGNGSQFPIAWLIPFTVDAPRLIRAGVLEFDDACCLLLAAHSAACDRSSLEIVLRDLSRHYFNLVQGCALPHPLTATADDYRRWVHNTYTPESGFKPSARIARLARLTTFTEGRTVARSTVAHDRKSSRRRLTGELAHALDELAYAMGIDVEAGPVTALFRAADECGLAFHVLGRPATGRSGIPQIEGVVGCFADIQLIFRPEGSSAYDLQRVHLALEAARVEAVIPFAHELSLAASEERWWQTPDITLRYQRIQPMAAGTIAMIPLTITPTGAWRLLELDVIHSDNEVILIASWCAFRMNSELVERLLDEFAIALTALSKGQPN
jgi:amino acid adenylation domain-containing protein